MERLTLAENGWYHMHDRDLLVGHILINILCVTWYIRDAQHLPVPSRHCQDKVRTSWGRLLMSYATRHALLDRWNSPVSHADTPLHYHPAFNHKRYTGLSLYQKLFGRWCRVTKDTMQSVIQNPMRSALLSKPCGFNPLVRRRSVCKPSNVAMPMERPMVVRCGCDPSFHTILCGRLRFQELAAISNI